MATQITTQLLVLGAGPGGYAAAFRAADLGFDVVLVSDDPQPGGTCLHRGCIPSKAFLHAGHLLEEARGAAAYGLTFAEPDIDPAKLNTWKNGIVAKLARGVEDLCRARRIRWLSGRADFLSSSAVEVFAGETMVVHFEHCFLATGSRPVRLRQFDLPSGRVMDSTAALQLERIPARMLVVGGGYIGLELGSVYSALGASVEAVELTGGLLPGVDRDLVAPFRARAEARLAGIHTGTKVTGMTDTDDGVRVVFAGEKSGEDLFDQVLVSVGRRPTSDGIGLENTGVRVDADGFVDVNEQQRTADPRIFAIGDVCGPPMLAHKAAYEGKVAAEVLAGEAAAMDVRATPAVVFTDPEIAWCGISETEADRRGLKVEVSRFPWAASGRAHTLGAADGLTKLVVDPGTGRVLGVGLVGSGAGELISEGVVAVEMGASVRDLAMSMHPHPTLSETLAGAAEVFLGSATDLFSPHSGAAD